MVLSRVDLGWRTGCHSSHALAGMALVGPGGPFSISGSILPATPPQLFFGLLSSRPSAPILLANFGAFESWPQAAWLGAGSNARIHSSARHLDASTCPQIAVTIVLVASLLVFEHTMARKKLQATLARTGNASLLLGIIRLHHDPDHLHLFAVLGGGLAGFWWRPAVRVDPDGVDVASMRLPPPSLADLAMSRVRLSAVSRWGIISRPFGRLILGCRIKTALPFFWCWSPSWCSGRKASSGANASRRRPEPPSKTWPLPPRRGGPRAKPMWACGKLPIFRFRSACAILVGLASTPAVRRYIQPTS